MGHAYSITAVKLIDLKTPRVTGSGMIETQFVRAFLFQANYL